MNTSADYDSPSAERIALALDDGPSPAEDVISIRTAPLDAGSWYGAHRVDVALRGGGRLDLFLKDFDDFRRRKEDLRGRRARERAVYRLLLRDADLGTAAYYGSLWDEEAPTHWLLIEFVAGELLKHVEFGCWIEAPRWLARWHAFSQDQSQATREGLGLRSIDLDLLRSASEQALALAAPRSDDVGRRLEAYVREYDARLGNLETLPVALVHGAFQPHNILVRDDGRICPVDWELVGWGPAAYDLAFFCDGFAGSELELLLDAYRDEAARYAVDVPPHDVLVSAMRLFQVHLTLLWVSQTADRGFVSSGFEGLVDRIGDLLEDSNDTTRTSR